MSSSRRRIQFPSVEGWRAKRDGVVVGAALRGRRSKIPVIAGLTRNPPPLYSNITNCHPARSEGSCRTMCGLPPPFLLNH